MILRWFSALVHSHFLIALCAVALTLETQVQIGLKPHIHPYLFLLFFATLFEYNLHRLITLIFVPQALQDEKYVWLKEHIKIFLLVVVFAVTGFIYTLSEAKKEVLIALAPLAVIALFYSTPVWHFGKRLFRLREIPYLKIFLIALVWSGATVLLPVIHTGKPWDIIQITLLLAERFFFILAITVPFDIRDLDADQKAGLKTLPMLFRKSNPLIISYLSLFVFGLVAVFHYRAMGKTYIAAALLFSALITTWFIVNKKFRTLPKYHLGILDGTLWLQGMLVLLFYFVFGP